MAPPPLDPARRAVMIDMAYELGGAGLEGFHRFLIAMRYGQWAVAAQELRSSLLYTQVPHREQSNIQILMIGTLPPGVLDAKGLVQLHEGFCMVGKPDAKGKWVIGWGHDIPSPEPGHSPPICSQAEASAWLDHDFTLALARARHALGADYWGEESVG